MSLATRNKLIVLTKKIIRVNLSYGGFTLSNVNQLIFDFKPYGSCYKEDDAY